MMLAPPFEIHDHPFSFWDLASRILCIYLSLFRPQPLNTAAGPRSFTCTVAYVSALENYRGVSTLIDSKTYPNFPNDLETIVLKKESNGAELGGFFGVRNGGLCCIEKHRSAPIKCLE